MIAVVANIKAPLGAEISAQNNDEVAANDELYGKRANRERLVAVVPMMELVLTSTRAPSCQHITLERPNARDLHRGTFEISNSDLICNF